MLESYKKPLRWRVVSGICVLRFISPPRAKNISFNLLGFRIFLRCQDVSKYLAKHISWCNMAARYWSVYFWLLCFLVVCDRDRMWQPHYFELFMSISIALMSHFPSEVSHNVCIVLRLQVLFSSPLRLSFSLIYYYLHFNLSLIHFLHCSADYLISWLLYYSACIAS